MNPAVTVGAVEDADFGPLWRMDLTYDASRVLTLVRTGAEDQPHLAFTWQDRAPETALYNTYTAAGLRPAAPNVDLFLVARTLEAACGLLIVVVPRWTDAGEITDLAVDRPSRGLGAGRALIDGAIALAKERSLRALWVEPRADNEAAIRFYVRLGFRISGFNDRMYSNTDAGSTAIFMYLEVPGDRSGLSAAR